MEEIPIWFHPIPHLLQNNLRKLAIAPDRWLATRQYHPFQAHCLQSESRDSKMPWPCEKKAQPVTLKHHKKCNHRHFVTFWWLFLTHFWPWKICSWTPHIGHHGIHTKHPNSLHGLCHRFPPWHQDTTKWRNQEIKLPQIQKYHVMVVTMFYSILLVYSFISTSASVMKTCSLIFLVAWIQARSCDASPTLCDIQNTIRHRAHMWHWSWSHSLPCFLHRQPWHRHLCLLIMR